jgi:hypothetical protein
MHTLLHNAVNCGLFGSLTRLFPVADPSVMWSERAAICIKQACEVGVLHWLHTCVLESSPFMDDLPFQKEIYAQIVGQLLISFLDAEPGRCAAPFLLPHIIFSSPLSMVSSPLPIPEAWGDLSCIVTPSGNLTGLSQSTSGVIEHLEFDIP